MKNGVFIAFDGTDGAGKTTQLSKLKERLESTGIRIHVADFPQLGTKSGGLCENYLNGKYGDVDEVDPKIASTFYAADRFDASFAMRAHLAKGGVVLSDRWVTANMGHQGAKIHDPQERLKMFEWIQELEYGLYKLPKPDLTIILYVNPDIIQRQVDKRGAREYLNGGVRDIHENNMNHLRLAAESYKQIAGILEKTVFINCMNEKELLSIEDIHIKIWAEVEKLFNKG